MVKKETFRWCPVTSSISSSPLLSRSLRAKNVFGLNSSFIQNSCCRWHECCYLWQLFLFLPNFLCCVLCQWMFDLQNIGESYFPPYKDQHGLKTSALQWPFYWPEQPWPPPASPARPSSARRPWFFLNEFVFYLPATLMCRSRCSSKNRFSIS